jgi:hypothetical protein
VSYFESYRNSAAGQRENQVVRPRNLGGHPFSEHSAGIRAVAEQRMIVRQLLASK